MRAAVRPLAPEPLFLGRDAELADLVTTGRAGLTSGRFLLVRGEGGIGKSTLIDAAIAQAPPERHVLRGAADAMDRRLTYGLLLDALGPSSPMRIGGSPRSRTSTSPASGCCR